MTDLQRFGSITGPQRIMMALLDDGPETDSVGLEAEALTASQIAVCERLAGKDLVRFDVGWRYSCWFRLTPAGREALYLLRCSGKSGLSPSKRRRTEIISHIDRS
ncbi:hypothetical protein [Aureimonas psammosilenae]|uniref:hypothetical protein n=1 Tax=Aureimonas psammosilenae TaxID=2495496 RepID=UPI0012608FFF|nr:hypothetical protein [Aureimonas psammosilenae]